jgi:hypothetical protein
MMGDDFDLFERPAFSGELLQLALCEPVKQPRHSAGISSLNPIDPGHVRLANSTRRKDLFHRCRSVPLNLDIRECADPQQLLPMLARPSFRQALAKHGTDTVRAGGDEVIRFPECDGTGEHSTLSLTQCRKYDGDSVRGWSISAQI